MSSKKRHLDVDEMTPRGASDMVFSGTHNEDHIDKYEDEFEEEVIVPSDEEADMNDDEGEERKGRGHVWRPGVDPVEPGEILDFEPSAYSVFHKLDVEWSCLSFDILKDSLGNFRTKYPTTLYAVTGSQADKGKNRVTVMKVSRLHRMRHEDDGDDGIDMDDKDDDADDVLDEEPLVEARAFKHDGTVNRIRAMPQDTNTVATWSETGKVHVWNISSIAESLESVGDSTPQDLKPLFTFSGHSSEGFALDWSKKKRGQLATGGVDKKIFIWNPVEGGTWEVESQPFNTHTSYVEDIQWSPSEQTVLASCSSDRTIRIWDTRAAARSKQMICVNAHNSDVNVISWNNIVTYLLASGADDGSIKIWDLRNLGENQPATSFAWHKKAITSIEWHPFEDSVLAASSDDDSLTVWDFGLEADEQEVAREGVGATIDDPTMPPQLFFEHMGQKHIKELHFHPQVSHLILSTSLNGIDIFKASNMGVTLAPAAPTEAAADGVAID